MDYSNQRPKCNLWLLRVFKGGRFGANGLELLKRDKKGGWLELERKCEVSGSGARFTGARAPQTPEDLKTAIEEEICALKNKGFKVEEPILPLTYTTVVEKWQSCGLFESDVTEEPSGVDADEIQDDESQANDGTNANETQPMEDSQAIMEMSHEVQSNLQALHNLSKMEADSGSDDEELLGCNSDGEPIMQKRQRLDSTASPSMLDPPPSPKTRRIMELEDELKQSHTTNEYLKRKELWNKRNYGSRDIPSE